MIELRTMGAIDLRDATGGAHHSLIAQPKRFALLVFLCAAKGTEWHRRDALLAVFWPRVREDRARASLRTALHGLRLSLGGDVVLTRGEHDVAIDRRLLSCDTVAFEGHMNSHRYERAVSLYGGDFLAGFFIHGTPQFERWVEERRAQLRGLACTALRQLTAERVRQGDDAGALEVALLAAELDPDDEPMVRTLLTLLDRAGDLAGASRTYDVFVRRLRHEYGTGPSPDTQRLMERIRRSGRANFRDP